MFKRYIFVSLLFIGLASQNVAANPDVDAALVNTQDCLRKQNCDTANSVAGKAANEQALKAVAGDAVKQQALYALSADILPILVQQSGGDPAKMQAIIMKAQNDPAAFLNSLPADIRAKIQTLSSSVGNDSLGQHR
jgi:hypothetical protein